MVTEETRRRRSEDIPEDLKRVISEDVIHRDYCPRSQKRFEPCVLNLLPSCTLGNLSLVLSALQHFVQGLIISQFVDTFKFHMRIMETASGFVFWYVQLHRLGLYYKKLHVDDIFRPPPLRDASIHQITTPADRVPTGGCPSFKYTAVGPESNSRLQFDRFNFSDESLVVVS